MIILTTSAGAAYTERALSVSGVGLRVPFTVFLIFGAIIIGVATIIAGLCASDALQLDKEIQRLYESIGFKDRTLYANIASPFRGEDSSLSAFAGILSGEDYHYGNALQTNGLISAFKAEGFAMFLGLTIPTAAQVAAGFKVSEIAHQAGFGWVWVFFVLLAIGTSDLALFHVWHEPFFPFFGELLPDNPTKVDRLRWQAIVIGIQVLVGTVIALPGVGIGYFVTKVLGKVLAS